MKRNIAYRWAKYLEMRGRKQTKGSLGDCKGPKVRASDPKCCLGHLEFMLGNPGMVAEDGAMKVPSKSLNGTTGMDTGCLSPWAREKSGMRSGTGRFFLGKDGSVMRGTAEPWGTAEFVSLASANDNGMTLKEIAKVIRKRWRDL